VPLFTRDQPPERTGDAPAKAVVVDRKAISRAKDPGVQVVHVSSGRQLTPESEHRLLNGVSFSHEVSVWSDLSRHHIQ
jgi:hypothetical protein